MKIWKVKAQDKKTDRLHGTIIGVSSDGIEVSAGDGTILIERLQMPGKKAMEAGNYIRGNKIEVGVQLGKQQ